MVSLTVLVAALALLAGGPSAAPDQDRPRLDDRDLILGGNPAWTKAGVDTVLVMGPWGSGAPYNGQFQDPSGAPAWNGWTSIDVTQQTDSKWHADTYHAVNGSWSAWCGEDTPSCAPDDPDGGYGNNYDETLEWRGTVADPLLSCTVTIDALLNHDVEPGYDYVWLSVLKAGQTEPVDLWSVDGTGLQVPVQAATVYTPADYVGPDSDEVVVQFRVTSDGGWSDVDCNYPSVGACQLDDATVSLGNGGFETFDDFEDGTLGSWAVMIPAGVGNFARIWTGLHDLDPCRENPSPQVAFIDDGVVVPGTGGSACLTWCYGPGGFIVNTTGGLAGPEAHLDNLILSPVMPWPDEGLNGFTLSFDVYQHEDLSNDSPGIFHHWGVRSTSSPDPAAIEAAGWQDRDSGTYYGGPDYVRRRFVVSDLIVTDRRWVQVSLGVWEHGWVWGWTGNDGYPAPYFDNVRVEPHLDPSPGPQDPRIGVGPGRLPGFGAPGSGRPRQQQRALRHGQQHLVGLSPAQRPGRLRSLRLHGHP